MSPSAHWLEPIAQGHLGDSAASVHIDPDASVAEAWSAVANQLALSERELAELVASHFGLRRASFELSEPRALPLLPEKVARRYGVFPLREDDRRLAVATSDPTDLDMEEAIRFASGRTSVFEIATPEEIGEAIETRYSPNRALDHLLSRLDPETTDRVRVIHREEPDAVRTGELLAPPVVRLTNLILHEATKEEASDIHLEPTPEGGSVRFRVDGVLRHYMRMPLYALNRVISRIKVMGKLDVADRLRPQDGRARIQVENKLFDLRMSTVPTRETEKAVIRILDPSAIRRLEDLGMPVPELERIQGLLSHRSGILVVTGPTGSGKTTTVYSAILRLANGEINIMSAEDPVEYELPGVTQIQIEPRRKVTFPSALRACLRQDPDVIFVGEIRDLETAEMAVQASSTGHLVLTTLHANDTTHVVARLRDIGLASASISSTLRGAVAQQLVRRLCRYCAQRINGELTPEEARLAHLYRAEPVARAVGCIRCAHTGYRGRLPVLEVLTASSRFQQMISSGTSPAQLRQSAISEGMRAMQEVALERVRAGETTLQEIERVLGGTAEQAPAAAGPHVLVVDDDAVNRKVARTLLERQGARVSEAADGVAALERIRRGGDFDLVVLDLMMPRLDGRGVLAELRSSVATATLPVVVLTGSENEEAEVQLMEQGADDYIRKPIEPLRFVARIKAALRRAAA